MTRSLNTLAIDGILPFSATVEVREDGRWVGYGQGSSVAWLDDVAREGAAVHGRARIVSQWGRTLATVAR